MKVISIIRKLKITKYFGVAVSIGLLANFVISCSQNTGDVRYSPAFVPPPTLQRQNVCADWNSQTWISVRSASVSQSSEIEKQITTLLERYVTDAGQVDYERWVSQPADLALLSELVRVLGETAEKDVLSISPLQNPQKSVWINFYNLATLQLVLTHYEDLLGEQNSPFPSAQSIQNIQDLGEDVWNKIKFAAGPHMISLNEIENRIRQPLTPQGVNLRDPRIHFAVNCASKSCPPLFPFAYTSANLEKELDERTCRFVNSGQMTIFDNLDPADPLLITSAILDWYQEDFGDRHQFFQTFLKVSTTPLTPSLLQKKNSGEYSWSLLTDPYDWTLNAAPSKSPTGEAL